MKKVIAALLAGTTLLSSTTAFADDHGRGHGRGHDKQKWNGNASRQYDRGYSNQYRVGQRYPYYNQSQYVVRDYRSYRLPPPRSGYQYYRNDNGDIVMAAIASGIIGLIIGSTLNNNNNNNNGYYDQGYGYNTSYNGNYNQGYGYQPAPAPRPYYPPPRPYYGY